MFDEYGVARKSVEEIYNGIVSGVRISDASAPTLSLSLSVSLSLSLSLDPVGEYMNL